MTKKTVKRVSADVGLMFTAFHLHRLINIIGRNEFKKFLEGLGVTYFYIIEIYRTIISKISIINFQPIFQHPKIKVA